MTDVDLNVVGDRLWGTFQKVGQAIVPSAPLEVLGGQCRDLDKCPDIGRYWVSYAPINCMPHLPLCGDRWG